MALAWRLFGSFPGSPTQPVPITELAPAPAGGWLPIAMSSPHAMYADGKTFWGYVDGTNGDICIAAYEHATSTLIGPVVLNNAFGTDDHNAPAVLIRSYDQRIVVVYCDQATPTSIRKIISTNPLDITDWSSTSTLTPAGSNYLYTTLIQVADVGPNRIYMYWKDFPNPTTTRMREASSSDAGGTFGGGSALWESTNAYWVIASDGLSRIDYVVTDSAPSLGVNNLYHFYQDTSLGQLYTSDGTPIVGIPIGPSDATLIYNGSEPMWPYSITYTSDGRPTVACATQESNPKYRDLRYISGTTWQESLITTSGVGGFFGDQVQGIAYAPTDANRVILGKHVGSSVFEMFQYVSSDDGQTWTGTQLTTGSGTDLPNAPAQVMDHGPFAFLWLTGEFTSESDYSFATIGAP